MKEPTQPSLVIDNNGSYDVEDMGEELADVLFELNGANNSLLVNMLPRPIVLKALDVLLGRWDLEDIDVTETISAAYLMSSFGTEQYSSITSRNRMTLAPCFFAPASVASIIVACVSLNAFSKW